MSLILRGLLGVVLGVAYGLLVGVYAHARAFAGVDRQHPGPLIPDAVGWAQFVTDATRLIAVACGVLVGLAVGLSGAGKPRAALVGFGVGFVVLALLSSNGWQELLRGSWLAWRFTLEYLLVLPCGLALTGVAVSAVADLFRPHG